MKIKYLIGALGLCALLTVGGYYGKDALTTYKAVSATVESGNNLVQEYSSLVSQSASLQDQLAAAGKDVFLDNTKIAEEFAGFQGATIATIDALEDASDPNSVLISITNPDDVAFFTDTVSAISYSFTINDFTTFINDLNKAVFIAEDVSINATEGTARIVVPSSSKLYAGDLDTDTLDTTTPAVPSTEAETTMPEYSTESVSIPENSGVYDSTETVPETNTSSESTIGDTSGNYYVIESTEGM